MQIPSLLSPSQTNICERFGILATRRICGLGHVDRGEDEKESRFAMGAEVNGELPLERS